MATGDDPAIIEPRKGSRESPLPSLAVLVFNPDDLESFRNCLTQPVQQSHSLYLSRVYTGYHEGVRLAVAGPMLGAPQTILVLERMIALGARRFIAVGWCGALQSSVRIADVVLPTSAASEEGTSRHYPVPAPAAGEARSPSTPLLEVLRSTMAPTGLKLHEGMVWTTDAPFRETRSKVLRFQSEGVLAVDMETSALLTVAAFRKVEIAVALVTSDDLSGLKWVHGFREPAFHEARKLVLQSTLAALRLAAKSSGPP